MAGHVAVESFEIRCFQLEFYCERSFKVSRPAATVPEWQDPSSIPGPPSRGRGDVQRSARELKVQTSDASRYTVVKCNVWG
jgi:hypothetical protein